MRAHGVTDVAAPPRLVVRIEVRTRGVGVGGCEELGRTTKRHPLERDPNREELA